MNFDGDEDGFGKVIFLQELAQYLTEQDENLKVVMESFEISKNEIAGIQNGSIIIDGNDQSKIWLPLKGDTYREAADILLNRR